MARDGVKIYIDGDDSGFKKSLSSIEKTAKKSLGVVVKGVGATSAGIAALAGVAINSFKEYEQLIGGIDTLFEASSQKVQQNAAKAYKTAGMSSNEYMKMTTGFAASLKQSFDDTAEGLDAAADVADMAVSDMSDNANKMGTDMELIQNAYQGFAKQNYTMLDNLKLGYGGTKTEMERLLADAQKLSGVKYDISSLADVYSAIHVIQEELGITGTTAKEAATTIEGSTKMMAASWSNLMTGLADDNADFDALLDEFIDSVLIVGDNILPRIKTTIEGIGEFASKAAAELLPEIADVLIDTLPSLLASVGKLAEGLGEALIESFKQIAENAPEIVDAAVKLAQGFLEGLKSFIPKLVKAAGEMIAAIAEALGDAVPILKPITAIAEVLGDNLQTIARMALAAVAAFKTFTIIQTVTKAIKGLVASYQTANLQLGLYTAQLGVSKIANVADLAALSAKEIVVGVLTGKIGLATAAQWLWNAAMSANPIGIVITAVAALAAGIAALASIQGQEKSATQLAIEENRRLTEAVKEQAETYEQLKASKTEQLTGELAQIANAKLLSEELERLADESGRVEEKDRGRAQVILGELNKALGTEYEMTGNVINQYDTLRSEIGSLIQAKQAQILLEAQEEKYAEAVKNKSAAVNAQNQAYFDLQQAIARINGEYEGLNLSVDEVVNALGNSAEMNKLTSSMSIKSAKELFELAEQYKSNSDTVQMYSNDMQLYTDAAAAAAEGNFGRVISMLDKENTAYRNSAEIQAEQSKLTVEEIGENYAKAVSAVEVAYNQLKVNNNEVNREALLSALTYANELRQAYEAAGGAIVDGQITGIDGNKIELSTKALEVMQAAAEACGESNIDFVASGKDAVAGIIAGLEDPESRKNLYNAAYACGLIELQGHDDAIGRNSPAKEFKYAAEDSVKGVVLGFDKGRKHVYKTAYNLAEEGIKGYNDGQDANSPAKEYIKASKNSVDGLIKGFEDNSDKLFKTLDEINDEMLHGEDISNEKLLESEKAYLEESLRIEREKEKTAEEIAEEAAEWKLKKLEETAEAERKILEEEKESYFDYLEERTNAMYEALEDIAEAQDKFSDKLNKETELFYEVKTTFKGLGENGTDLEFTKGKLSDLKAQSEAAQEYTDLLLAVKKRGAVPKDFFSELRDMSVEEGTLFAKTLLAASDEEFERYITDWESLQNANDIRAKEIFGDDFSEVRKAFEEEWGQVPEEFFDLGEDALEKFGEGFRNQLGGMLESIKSEIERSMGMLVNNPVAHGGLLAQTAANTWNSTYIINAAGNETTSQLLRATRNFNITERLRTQ